MIDVLLDAEKDTLSVNAEGDALNVLVTSFMVAGVTSSRVISAALMRLFFTVLQLSSASQKRSAELRDMALEASSQTDGRVRRLSFALLAALCGVRGASHRSNVRWPNPLTSCAANASIATQHI